MTQTICQDLASNLEKVNYFGNTFLESNVIIYTILASVIASFGFLHNTNVPIIGSMLISPVLAPLYNSLTRFISKKPSKVINNVLYHLFLLTICVIIGFVAVTINQKTKLYPDETQQMINRTTYGTLVSDIGVASMCGIGIAFAILRGDIITRVGFGIAITVLPAMVNAGMYLGLYYHAYLKNNKNKQDEYIDKCKRTATLTVVNVLSCMLLSFIFLSVYCSFVSN